ncbi:hypothetical protein AB6E53_02460 [Vibrio breoganii]|uniref:Uncharacterized protein n=1 Tax=Vibrio breoganii TaxID=553239 RepID=A0AAP8MVL2_9VIBR|nr:hypothetical protein [Vibrio breoganii]PMP10250.1 hypothetical protein BCS93_11280 [Vibrio breoganii]
MNVLNINKTISAPPSEFPLVALERNEIIEDSFGDYIDNHLHELLNDGELLCLDRGDFNNWISEKEDLRFDATIGCLLDEFVCINQDKLKKAYLQLKEKYADEYI